MSGIVRNTYVRNSLEGAVLNNKEIRVLNYLCGSKKILQNEPFSNEKFEILLDYTEKSWWYNPIKPAKIIMLAPVHVR